MAKEKLSNTTFRVWASKLGRYEFEAVKAAIDRHLRLKPTFFPSLAEIDYSMKPKPPTAIDRAFDRAIEERVWEERYVEMGRKLFLEEMERQELALVRTKVHEDNGARDVWEWLPVETAIKAPNGAYDPSYLMAPTEQLPETVEKQLFHDMETWHSALWRPALGAGQSDDDEVSGPEP